MRRYGLLGKSLQHSFSQRWFTEKFTAEGIDALYQNLEYPLLNYAAIAELKCIDGFNVTIPYKQEIISYLDRLTPEAQGIGAVNAVKLTREGKLEGHNTDYYGFKRALFELLNDAIPQKALVLGTGGASKAVCKVLKDMKIGVTLVSRTKKNGIPYEALTREDVSTHLLIVNTTPLGMWPNIDSFPTLPYQEITPQHFCFDLVYNPETTMFMQLCKEQGAKVCNGLKMLEYQAQEAWEYWNR